MGNGEVVARGKLFDEKVLAERARQNKKWGDQSHLSLERWSLILGEEYGEFQKALLDYLYEKDTLEHLIEELVQVAAVCRSMFEQNPTLVEPPVDSDISNV